MKVKFEPVILKTPNWDQRCRGECAGFDLFDAIALDLGITYQPGPLWDRIKAAHNSGDFHLETIPVSVWRGLEDTYYDQPRLRKIRAERGMPSTQRLEGAWHIAAWVQLNKELNQYAQRVR